VLELAVLGSLHERPMHGYELRKQLNALLGSFRALSYGTLYPALKALLARRLIAEDHPEDPAQAGKRSKIVYRLTAEGKERFQDLLGEAGPSAWDDETFGVHFAFFSRTDADVRLRILEGRRSRLESGSTGCAHRLSGPASGWTPTPRAAAPWPGVGGARGALAHRAHRDRADGGGAPCARPAARPPVRHHQPAPSPAISD